jgi:hypothetical protein
MELLRSKTRRCWAFWRAWFFRLSSSGSYYRARILIGPDAYSSVAELLEVRPIEILNSMPLSAERKAQPDLSIRSKTSFLKSSPMSW